MVSSIIPTVPGSEYGLHTMKQKTNSSSLFISRLALVEHCNKVLPSDPIVVEVGVFHGYFSPHLLKIFKPKSLFLIDTFSTDDFITRKFTAASHFEYIKQKFVNESNVKCIQGLSWDALNTLDDNSCDYIYIDADHSYESVKKDINVALKKIKHGGVVQFNDYCNFSALEQSRYGVQDAVNELIEMSDNTYDISILGMSLDRSGYHDIALVIHKQSDFTNKLNIVTPCTRPENLDTIYKSINFEKVKIWYIIYDVRKVVYKKRFSHPKIIELACTDEGTVGHQIRNMAINMIPYGLIYFLDDDNQIHPSFWDLDIKCNKIYTFNMQYSDGRILKGDVPAPNKIDTAQYVFDVNLVHNLQFDSFNYQADGCFIQQLCKDNLKNWQYVDKCMACYNALTWSVPLPLPLPKTRIL